MPFILVLNNKYLLLTLKMKEQEKYNANILTTKYTLIKKQTAKNF